MKSLMLMKVMGLSTNPMGIYYMLFILKSSLCMGKCFNIPPHSE